MVTVLYSMLVVSVFVHGMTAFAATVVRRIGRSFAYRPRASTYAIRPASPPLDSAPDPEALSEPAPAPAREKLVVNLTLIRTTRPFQSRLRS